MMTRRGLSLKAATIRDASRGDLFAMTSLLAELFTLESDFTPNLQRQREGLAALMAEPDAVLLVALVKNQIVGMCTLQTIISTAEGGEAGVVEDLVVDKNFRGMGVGRLLLQAIEKRAVERGMTRLQLLTDQGVDATERFYDRLDWKPTQLVVRRKVIA